MDFEAIAVGSETAGLVADHDHHRLRQQGFGPGAWAYTFGISALPLAALLKSRSGRSMAMLATSQGAHCRRRAACWTPARRTRAPLPAGSSGLSERSLRVRPLRPILADRKERSA